MSKKMMKKVIIAVLSCLLLTFVGCGSTKGTSNEEANTTSMVDASNSESLGEVDEAKPDWVDSKFSIDGVEYQLPIEMSKWIENGWKVHHVTGWDYSDVILDPQSRMWNITSEKPDYEFTHHQTLIEIANLNDKEITADEGVIISISVDISDYYRNPETQPEFILGEKITWESTKEEVISFLGTPTKERDNDIEYNYNDYDYYMEFDFNDETGSLEHVDITTWKYDLSRMEDLKLVEE